MKVAIITARGGSKGLPRKNILPLFGKPLIAWSIEAAINSSAVDEVFVSTEDAEIAEISLSYGAKVISRPPELALDTSSSEVVIEHALGWLEDHGIFCSAVVLMQPTSPLRTSLHINEALELFQSQSADCVLSVFEPTHTPIKAYVERCDGTLTGLFSEGAPYTRRQDLPKAYQPNGAIYIFSVEMFKLNNRIPRNNVYPYVMPEQDSVDIDTFADFVNVEQSLKDASK